MLGVFLQGKVHSCRGNIISIQNITVAQLEEYVYIFNIDIIQVMCDSTLKLGYHFLIKAG